MSERILGGLLVMALALTVPLAVAKAPADACAKLGAELTPIGAEKAGNKDGTIPEWKAAPRRGKLKDEYPNDPALDVEKPLFVIDGKNAAQYSKNLSEGHKELLRRYPDTYKMKVYKTHRDIGWPDEIYAATKANCATAELKGTDVPSNAKLGFPFPVPQSGAEPVWNHKLKWRGEAVRRYNNQMIVQLSGQFTLTKLVEEVKFYYASIKNPRPAASGAEFVRYLSETLAPPRLAGTVILVHERAGTGTEGRNAWLYSPGLRRIRRAPTVCCDNPYEGTDGHQFYDQVDMFNGVLERYNWKLVGKKEIFVPYHGNKLASNKTKYKDLARPKHLNAELPRYELHRVWVVEGEVRAGTSHTFRKRRFYIDEDSWNITLVDLYDNRNQLYQFQEGHMINGSNILAGGTVPELIYHLNSGRYFITAMFNEDEPYNFTVEYPDDKFSSASVQKRSTK